MTALKFRDDKNYQHQSTTNSAKLYDCSLYLAGPIQSFPQLPREYSALDTELNTEVEELLSVPSLRLPNAKVPLHLGGVKQCMVKDKSAQILQVVVGICTGTFASAV